MGCKGVDTVDNRFKELVHYVCSLCHGDGRSELGAVKLNKILWYIDTSSFCKNGKTISGETAYIKRRRGPVPKRIRSTTKSLENEGVLKVVEPAAEYESRQFVVLKKSEGECFDDDEKSIIKEHTFDIYLKHSGRSISDKSHEMVWWDSVVVGAEIPVYAILARPAEITDDDRKWAAEAVQEVQRVGI